MEKNEQIKKHACPDCDFCQCCSESRCALCRSTCALKGKKDKKPKTHKPLFLKF